MASLGDHGDPAHSLIPLALAAGLIRQKVYGERRLTLQGFDADLCALATVIVATVPIYEYASNPAKPPRALQEAELRGGLFRNGAKELGFLDGRPAKRSLALHAADVECVIAVLREPERAAQLHRHYARLRSRVLGIT